MLVTCRIVVFICGDSRQTLTGLKERKRQRQTDEKRWRQRQADRQSGRPRERDRRIEVDRQTERFRDS